MIYTGRLFASGFNASASRNPTAWMVGHKLWYRSWHQVPAASLPDDDGELCHLAELGFDLKTFAKVKAVAMRGWIKCGDGLLYHPVVAEAALEAWIRKLQQRLSSGAGNAKRYGHDFDPLPIEAKINVAIGMLGNLNPASKAIPKAKRGNSQAAPGGSATGTPPASQETGTGTGTVLEEESPYQKGAEVIHLGAGGRA